MRSLLLNVPSRVKRLDCSCRVAAQFNNDAGANCPPAWLFTFWSVISFLGLRWALPGQIAQLFRFGVIRNMPTQRQAALIGTIGLGLLVSGCDLTDRSTKPEVACFSNLRTIDGAEQQWALEQHKTTNDVPTWNDLQSYLRYTNFVCPAGGTYKLARIGEPPSCSVSEHAKLYRAERPQAGSPGQ